jgi:hypothetical protein
MPKIIQVTMLYIANSIRGKKATITFRLGELNSDTATTRYVVDISLVDGTIEIKYNDGLIRKFIRPSFDITCSSNREEIEEMVQEGEKLNERRTIELTKREDNLCQTHQLRTNR